jgi:hypothetical protein
MTTPDAKTITYICGQPISELSREELEAIVEEAAAVIQELQAENSRLRCEQFCALGRHL